MSFLRFTKVAKPSSPAANTVRVYHDTAGPGYLTPVALCAVDESGNQAVLAHFASLDYRLLKVTSVIATGAGTWTPTVGCRAAYVELIGGGGQGGGAATSSSTCSIGGGGGGGGYSASWITGVTAAVSYSVGPGGSGGTAGNTGGNGGDTTWASTVIVAKGGQGGVVLAAGSTVALAAGGAGGAAASGTGDLKIDGSIGDGGTRDTLAIGFSGGGGEAPFVGVRGTNGKAVVSGGIAGAAAPSTSYGSGGGGAATITTAAAGGNGAGGLIRIWEFS